MLTLKETALSGDVIAFGVSSSDIKYAQKTNGVWGAETSTVPSGIGSFRASITAGCVTASVEYGVKTITIMEPDSSKVAAPTIAGAGAVVPIKASPDIGYELVARLVKKSDNTEIDVISDENHNKSFIMPDDDVLVYWSFELADYKLDLGELKGSADVYPLTAQYDETVRVVITPNASYGIYSISVPGVPGVPLTLISRDTDTGAEAYTLKMPNKDIKFTIDLRETTIYTILYKAADTVTSVLYRFNTVSSDVGFKMKSDTKIDDLVCWAGQVRGVVDLTSFPISFKEDADDWRNPQNCPVVDEPSSLSDMNDGSAILISGDTKIFVASFKWGYYDTDAAGNLQLRSDYGTKYFLSTPTRRAYQSLIPHVTVMTLLAGHSRTRITKLKR